MKLSISIVTFALCLLFAAPALAQRPLTAGVTNTETFDSFGTGDVNVTNNTTIQGFYAFRTVGDADPNPFIGENGSSAVQQFYNFGPSVVAERAAGAIQASTTGTTYLGLRYANTTSFPIASITVQYTGEQWRGGTEDPGALLFSYQTSATAITSLTAGTWTSVTALDFAAPTVVASGGQLDGNAAANRQVLTANIQVNIPVGGEIMLRWADDNDLGSDDGLAIDDVSVTIITVTAGEVSVSGRVTTANDSGIRGAYVTVQGGDLTESKTVKTSKSGDFTLEGLTAGQTYFVSVKAKKYTFDDPVQTLSISDNVVDLVFKATR